MYLFNYLVDKNYLKQKKKKNKKKLYFGENLITTRI